MKTVFTAFFLLLLLAGTGSAQPNYWRERFESVGYNVAINPLNPNTIYAEDRTGVLNLSRNKGKTWIPLNPVPGPFRGLRNILVHPRDTLTIFVMRDQGGLWKTTNEGQTWNDVLPGFGIDGESIDYDKQHPDTMFVGDFFTTRIYRSLDRGETWSIQSTLGSMICGLTVRPDSGNIILAGTGNGTMGKSTDYGVTWTQVYNAGTNEVPKIVFNPSNAMVGYANVFVDNPPETNCGLIKTTDGGNSWFRTAILRDTSLWSIVMDEAHPETVYVGRFSSNGYGIDRTTDGGATYQHFQEGIKIDPSGPYSGFSAWNLKLNRLAPNDVWMAGSQNSFSPAWPGAVYHFVDSNSTTIVQGTVRDSITNNPLIATLTIPSTFETRNVNGTYSFKYFDDDPSLTPAVHLTSAQHFPKDTTLGFVAGTTQNQDIHLQPLPFNSINGHVFNDLNKNGALDDGEPGLANWLVRISGPVNDSMLTDAEGQFSFDSLTSGKYTLSQQLQDGYIALAPLCPASFSVAFTAGTSVSNVDFSNEQYLPGAVLLSESFAISPFPPGCWSIVDMNGGFTWQADGAAYFSPPASALCGSTLIGDGPSNDWLFSPGIYLKSGRVYKLSWIDRTSSNTTPVDSLAITVGYGQTPGAVTSIINNRAFNTNFGFEQVQQEFSVNRDSTYYIGFHDYSAAAARLRIDNVSLTLERLLGYISGTKFNDLNHNGVRDLGEPGVPNWKILLSGDKVDSTFTDASGKYLFPVPGGSFTVAEESKAGWIQKFPLSGTYSITLANGDSSVGNDFGNTHLNSLTVRKFEDNDANFLTDGDRAPKVWRLEIHAGSPAGDIVSNNDASSIDGIDLYDSTYYAVETDSAGWFHLGYLIDGSATASTDNNVGVTLSGGQHRTVEFVNAGPAYGRRFRTALYEEWARSVDGKGKPKSFKRKFDRVFFKRTFGAPTAATGFTLKFNMPSTGATTLGTVKTDTIAPTTFWDSVKTISYTRAIAQGDTFQVDGRGYQGKKFELTVTWATAPKAIAVKYSKDAPDWKRNQPALHMPNLHNVGEELFPKGFGQGGNTYFSSLSPLVVGVPRGTKGASSVILKTYSNVIKSFIVTRTNSIHTLGPKCLGRFENNDSIKSQQTSLPPNKQSNVAFGELLALKLNIAASAMNKFPNGLGELTFNDPSDPTNPFNGQRVDTICRKADTLLACLPVNSKPANADLATVYDVIHKIDSAFSDGTIDTVTFGVKTSLSGVRKLIDVPYLHITPGAVPANFTSPPVDESAVPMEYTLYQNYPNPFNPTTTVSFFIGQPSSVTLKVYNMLGQEVVALLDHQALDEGQQDVEFNAASLASGVYFYRIIAEPVAGDDGEDVSGGQTFVSMKKMILLK